MGSGRSDRSGQGPRGASDRRQSRSVVSLDAEPRRSRVATVAAIGSGILLLVLLVVPPVLRSHYGINSEAAAAGILLLVLAAVPIGFVLLVLAVIGAVRSLGTPRLGSLLLIIDGAVQLAYGLFGLRQLTVDALRDSVALWIWALLSILLAVVGCVLVLARPRSLGAIRVPSRHRDDDED